MNRTTFLQARLSRIPTAVGTCASDVPGLASYINDAQQRLLIAGGETGWYGTWQKVAFAVDPNLPYITLPRQIARIINLDVCKHPVRIQNEFYEFLEAGVGLQPANSCDCQTPCQLLETYDRGVVPTFVDLVPPKLVRVYASTSRDYGRRVFLQGLDTNNVVVRTLDNGLDVDGEFVTLAAPFATSAYAYNQLAGLQKDVTAGNVRFYQVDATTGAQSLMHLMEPSETVAAYRRYFLNGITHLCCSATGGSATTTSVSAMAKLEFIPVSVDTDYLLIGNLPALKLECMAVRLGETDSDKAHELAIKLHLQAVDLLNKELVHYTGRMNPAVNFAPFGNARLEYQRIGTLI